MDTLPDELLNEIFTYLPRNRFSKQDLVNAGLINKRCCSIVAPLLYENCCITGQDPEWLLRRFAMLLRTLISSKELRLRVKTIYIPGVLMDWPVEKRAWEKPDLLHGPVDKTIRNLMNKFTALSVSELVAATRPIQGHPILQELLSESRKSTQSALSAVLLSILPNMRSLRLQFGICNELDFHEMSRRQFDRSQMLVSRLVGLAGQPSTLHGRRLFDRLTVVEIDGGMGGTGYTWDLSLASVFLRIPSLHEFKGNFCSVYPEMKFWQCGERESNVEYITLVDFDVPTSALVKMIRSCIAIKEFSMHWTNAFGGSKNHDEFDCLELRDELLYHRQSLRKLSLESHYCEYEDQYAAFCIDTLTEFESLTSLRIYQNALYGGEDFTRVSLDHVLPPNLSEFAFNFNLDLGVDGFHPSVTEFVVDLVPAMQARSKLQKVKIYTRRGVSDADVVFLEAYPGIAIEWNETDGLKDRFTVHRTDVKDND